MQKSLQAGSEMNLTLVIIVSVQIILVAAQDPFQYWQNLLRGIQGTSIRDNVPTPTRRRPSSSGGSPKLRICEQPKYSKHKSCVLPYKQRKESCSKYFPKSANASHHSLRKRGIGSCWDKNPCAGPVYEEPIVTAQEIAPPYGERDVLACEVEDGSYQQTISYPRCVADFLEDYPAMKCELQRVIIKAAVYKIAPDAGEDPIEIIDVSVNGPCALVELY